MFQLYVKFYVLSHKFSILSTILLPFIFIFAQIKTSIYEYQIRKTRREKQKNLRDCARSMYYPSYHRPLRPVRRTMRPQHRLMRVVLLHRDLSCRTRRMDEHGKDQRPRRRVHTLVVGRTLNQSPIFLSTTPRGRLYPLITLIANSLHTYIFVAC